MKFPHFALPALLAIAGSSLLRAEDTDADWASSLIPRLPASEKATPLFDGTSLAGWEGWAPYWSVADGTIRGANDKPVPSSTYLFTKKSYRNFRLLFEVRQTISPDHSTMHSAVGALGERTDDAGDNSFGFRGPLLMFCHDWGIWDAHRRNRVVPGEHQGTLRIEAEKKGDWNRIEILVTGNRIRFVANGDLVFDFTDEADMLRDSPIGLQLHANRQAQEFHFRGLVLAENPEDSLVSLAEE